jgi:hypothetical protein
MRSFTNSNGSSIRAPKLQSDAMDVFLKIMRPIGECGDGLKSHIAYNRGKDVEPLRIDENTSNDDGNLDVFEGRAILQSFTNRNGS